MTKSSNPFRLNVGFLIQQAVGYSRTLPIDLSYAILGDDLEIFSVEGEVRVTRTPQGILAQVDLQGSTPMECVRCLDTFMLPLSTEFTELYAFSEDKASEDDQVLPDDNVVDLGPLLREYLLLDIPISPLCEPDCRGLCPVCGEDRNETDCEHEVEDIDPRLAALQTLLDE